MTSSLRSGNIIMTPSDIRAWVRILRTDFPLRKFPLSLLHHGFTHMEMELCGVYAFQFHTDPFSLPCNRHFFHALQTFLIIFYITNLSILLKWSRRIAYQNFFKKYKDFGWHRRSWYIQRASTCKTILPSNQTVLITELTWMSVWCIFSIMIIISLMMIKTLESRQNVFKISLKSSCKTLLS